MITVTIILNPIEHSPSNQLPDMSRLKIAGVQMDIRFADQVANLDKMRTMAVEAASQDAQLIVFPECTVSGYCFDSLSEACQFAAPIENQTNDYIRSVQAIAEETRALIVFGFLEIEANWSPSSNGDNVEIPECGSSESVVAAYDRGSQPQRLFNTVVLVDATGLISRYRKLHLPHLGVDRFTSASTDAPQVVSIHQIDDHLVDLRLGMNICYDISFPESARLLMLQGADLIVLPTNWPPTSGLVSEFVPNTRALENHLYFMSVNRIGTERGISFIGNSKICDPAGRDLAFANHNREAIIYAEIEPLRSRQKHLVNIPGVHEVHRVNDRRPEMYHRLTETTFPEKIQ